MRLVSTYYRKTINTNKIVSIDYNPTPSTTPTSSIDYLHSMYDLWEEKSEDKWEKLESISEMMLKDSDLSDKSGKMSQIKDIITKIKSGIDMTNSWWVLPEWMKDIIKPLTKLKKEWEMPVYKTSDNKDWYMDIPMLMTWKESLTGGTEKCLDWWYEKLSGNKPTPDSKMRLTLSKYPMEGCTTTLDYIGDDKHWSESSWYEDKTSGSCCWLCPYLPWLMDGKPKKMYVTMEITK